MTISKSISRLRLIYAVSIIVSLSFILLFHPIEYNDTHSYLRAWDNISSGQLDTFRTPLYPIFLGSLKGMFGKAWDWVAIIVQYLVFLLSIRYFYLLTLGLLKEKWALVTTAFYAIYPTFNSWGNLLLTDSLSLSLSVIFFYACYKIINEGSIKHTFLMTALLLLLLALRPSNISLLIPAAFSFLLLLFVKEKRLASITSLVGVMVCSILLVGYSFNIKEKTGVFTPSTVSVSNNLTIARMYGYLSPDALDDPHRSEVIRQNYEKYGEELSEGPAMFGAIGDLVNEFSVAEMKQLVDKSIKLNPLAWFKALVKRFYFASLMPATTSYTSDVFRLLPLFPINIGIIILILLAYSVLIVIRIIKGCFHHVPFFLLITSLCVIGVSIVGAQYEYNRLILPVMPIILIIIGQLSQLFYDTKCQH